jgi:hypothetical protein
MPANSCCKRKSPEKPGRGNDLVSMFKVKHDQNNAAAAEDKASKLAVAAAAAAVEAANARRLADVVLNHASSAGVNNDRDNPQEILESFLGEVSSTVKSAFDDAIIISCDEEDAFEVFNDVSLPVIEKILGDIVATVEFNINNEPTQDFNKTAAWLEGKETAPLGMKETRSLEIIMNRASLKDLSWGGADGGGSSAGQKQKKQKGEKHMEEDRGFLARWTAGREWLLLRGVAHIIPATDAEPEKTFLKKAMHCSICEAANVVCNFTGAGCISLRLPTIQRHENSAHHKTAMQAQKRSNDFMVCVNNNIMLEVISTICNHLILFAFFDTPNVRRM